MTLLFRNTLFFVVGYVIFMIPTYLLPWLGSNSSIIKAAFGTETNNLSNRPRHGHLPTDSTQASLYR
jgi:hypothetical protein